MKRIWKALSFVIIFYLLGGTAGLILFVIAANTGWEPAQEPRGTIPADVRSSPGGYRSQHFWYRGYHGGK